MKRILITLLALLLVFTTITPVFALYIDDPYAQELLKQGYTEEDILELSAVFALLTISGNNTTTYKDIMHYYYYFCQSNWKKVREYYNIDEKAYEDYMFGRMMWQAVLDRVPENVINDMKKRGWKQSQINRFVNDMNVMNIDFEYGWNEYKNGKTVDELVEEKDSADMEFSKLSTEFVWGEMSDEEYISRLKKIPFTDESTIEKSLEDAKASREERREKYRERSGITDEEIEYCKNQGMTNPMSIYQAKMISSGNNLLLEDVVHTYLRVKSWTITIIELTDITPEEYIEQLRGSIDDPAKEKEKIKEIEDYYFSTDKSNSDTNEFDIKDYTALYVGSNNAYINGEKKLLDEENADVSVFVDDDRSYVPVRFISENYGGKVEWVEETQTVNILFDDKKISLTIGKPEITVDGKTTPIDVSPVLENGRTFLPLRACADALSKEVFYGNGLILISDNPNTLDETEDSDKINAVINKYFK